LPKNLVVCCDGTWNIPDETRGSVAAPTNVAKLALAVAQDQATQRLYYEPGVGTAPDERIVGGAFGYGLSHNIRNCYAYLAANYDDGDRLFLLGFSRGAYTARSLAGLIRNCGILRREHTDQVDAAFAFYRDRTSHTHPSAIASHLFRDMYSCGDQTIHFIGVWDTVGALGIPNDLPGWEEISKLFTGWEQMWGFHDTQLSSQVTHARHALSIDEERAAFRPTLWTQDQKAIDAGQDLKQVWFSGVHSEVGGGSADTSLSDIALLWMTREAAAAGLRFRAGLPGAGWPEHDIAPAAPSYDGLLVNSRHGIWALVHPFHRLKEPPDENARGQAISTTAKRRFDDPQAKYSPLGFADYAAGLGGAEEDVAGG
jgi:uncharacterized protein (DUF2235 family)